LVLRQNGTTLCMVFIFHKKHGVDYYFNPSSKHFENIRKQFELFLQLREKTRVDSPKTYEAFATREDDWWYAMQRYVLDSTNIILTEDILQKNFDCSSPSVINHLESREQILLYASNDYRTEISKHSKSYIANSVYNFHPLGKGTTFKLIKEKCNTPYIQAFEEYPQRIREINNVSN